MMIGKLFYIKLLIGSIERFITYHSKVLPMTNTIPEIVQYQDGFWWATQTDSNGPFASEDEALNDYVDRHECEEE
jgi:hypothetical protein